MCDRNRSVIEHSNFVFSQVAHLRRSLCIYHAVYNLALTSWKRILFCLTSEKKSILETSSG